MTVEYNFFDPVLNEQGQPDRVYNAEEFTNYFKTLVTTGIMRQHENELQVSADGTTMQTAVSTGTCFVEGRRMRVKAPYLLLHDTESVGLKRIDRIVARLDLRVEARHVMPFIKKGVAATNPVAPTLQRDNEVYEISLASVTVTGGRSYITNDDILDERANEALCGWSSSDIFPNYNDATLQAVLQQVQESNDDLANHMNQPILHTPYGIATGTNAKSVTVNLPVEQLIDGMAVVFKNQTANTGAVTLNVNGLAAKPIKNADGLDLLNQVLKANSIYTVRYNAATENFILQGEGGSVFKTNLVAGNDIRVKTLSDITMQINTALTKIHEFKMIREGSIRLKFSLRPNVNVKTAGVTIYKNDVAISEEFETTNQSGMTTEHQFNVSVVAGDRIQIFARNNNSSIYASYFITNIGVWLGNEVNWQVIE